MVLVAPIFDADEKFMGSLSIVIFPDEFISPYVESTIASSGYFMWAMQVNGTLIYDPDPAQEGKNLLTDSIYADSPDLQTFANRVAAAPSGYGT